VIRLETVNDIGTDGHLTHALNAARDDQVLRAGQNTLGRKMHGLLPGATLSIHCCTGHGLTQYRRKGDIARNIGGLRAHLGDTPENQIVDLRHGHASSLNQRIHHGRTKINRVNL
jgi:hypothetical protein